jgi:hypothetical protein
MLKGKSGRAGKEMIRSDLRKISCTKYKTTLWIMPKKP